VHHMKKWVEEEMKWRKEMGEEQMIGEMGEGMGWRIGWRNEVKKWGKKGGTTASNMIAMNLRMFS
jgi:hypothetical protein